MSATALSADSGDSAEVKPAPVTGHAGRAGGGEAGGNFDQNDAAFRRRFDSFRNAVLDLVGMGEEDGKAVKARETERKNHARCQKWKWRLLRNDPAVIFMIDKIKEAGCEVDPVRHITCITCDTARGAGFSVEEGVQLCENHVDEKRMMQEALLHELIHAYDHCRYKVDWMNLYHHACTEIRAANLSGDCRLMNEFRRGYVGFVGHHQTCVRRRAIKSVVVNPNCPDEATAERAVNRVFNSCFHDTTPFEEGLYY